MLYISKHDGGQIVDLTAPQMKYLSKDYKSGLVPYSPTIEIPDEYENEFNNTNDDGENSDMLLEKTAVDDGGTGELVDSKEAGDDLGGSDTAGSGNTSGVLGAISKPITGNGKGNPAAKFGNKAASQTTPKVPITKTGK